MRTRRASCCTPRWVHRAQGKDPVTLRVGMPYQFGEVLTPELVDKEAALLHEVLTAHLPQGVLEKLRAMLAEAAR